MLASRLLFNLRWASHRHTKSSNSSQYCMLHSVLQTTEFSSKGTKLEITSANEISTDRRHEPKETQPKRGCKETKRNTTQLNGSSTHSQPQSVTFTRTPARLLLAQNADKMSFFSSFFFPMSLADCPEYKPTQRRKPNKPSALCWF